ncbi:MAG: hypothetical protein ACK4TP_13080 [Hyphomicrobium sp.]|jgi:hypothetical protein
MALKTNVPALPSRRAVLQALLAFAEAGVLTAMVSTTRFSRASAAGRAVSLSLDTRALVLDGRRLVLEIAGD